MTTAPTQEAVYVSTHNFSGNRSVAIVCNDGDLLVVHALDQTGGTRTAPTDDGPGLTWTESFTQYTGTGSCGAWGFYAVVGTGQGGSFNVTVPHPSAYWSYVLYRYSGSDGIGNNVRAQASSGEPSPSLTLTGENSAVIESIGNRNGGATTPTWLTIAGATFTQDLGWNQGSTTAQYFGSFDDVGTGASVTVGTSAPSMKYTFVALEILGSAGGGAALTADQSDTAGDTDNLVKDTSQSLLESKGNVDSLSSATGQTKLDSNSNTDSRAISASKSVIDSGGSTASLVVNAGKSITDSDGNTDALSVAGNKLVSDSSSLTDSIDVSTGGSSLTKSLSEDNTDVEQLVLDATKNIIDSAARTDAKVIDVTKSVDDDVGKSDALIAFFLLKGVIDLSEVIDVFEINTNELDPTIIESIQISDDIIINYSSKGGVPMSVADSTREWLSGLGYAGSIQDMQYAFLLDEYTSQIGAPTYSLSTADMQNALGVQVRTVLRELEYA